MAEVIEGAFTGGLTYLRLGAGPPLVMSPGIGPSNEAPQGLMRRAMLSSAAPFAKSFTVYCLNRRVQMPTSWGMREIANDYADAIEQIGEPVLLHGASSGGSVALQVATDHQGLVRRMVVASAAHRLSARGRRIQGEFARLIRRGRPRQAYAHLARALAPGLARPAVGALGWLAGARVGRTDHRDMLTTIAAEDTFDAEQSLHTVTAPTLVLGGSTDPLYSPELFHRTADPIPDGRAVVFQGKGHAYPAGTKASALAVGFLLG